MSTLKEQYEDDVYMFLEDGHPWVYQATFTPQVGAPVTLNQNGDPLTVIFEQEQFDSPDDYETRVSEMQYRIEGLIVDLGKVPVAATPNDAGDYFTIDSTDYEVTGIDVADNDFVTCSVRLKA